jgi:protein gp37
MDNTKIGWTNASWNPIRGCSRVSEGCRHCYAEQMAARFSGRGLPYEGLAVLDERGGRWTNTVRVIETQMDQPLRWRKPRRIFVNSMSDLFHEGLSDHEIDRVFAVMLLAPQHTFQVLTKRATRMMDYMTPGCAKRAGAVGQMAFERARDEFGGTRDARKFQFNWPLPNVWLGVSCEDQKTADERVPLLLETPAAVRWVSAEPLLGPVDLGAAEGLPVYREAKEVTERCGLTATILLTRPRRGWVRHDGNMHPWLDWVVVGGESGRHTPQSPERWMKHEWARAIRDQCIATDTSYFFKQSSGVRAGAGAALEHEDGSLWEWRQYPGELTPPVCVGRTPYLGALDGPGGKR